MIIVLHGFGSSGDVSSTCQAFKEHFKHDRVLTPTWDPSQPSESLENIIELIDLIKEENPKEHIHIAGISFGGYIAQVLAAMLKHKMSDHNVDSLLLMNPVMEGTKACFKLLGINESYVDGQEPIIMTFDTASQYQILDKFLDYSSKTSTVWHSLIVGLKDDVIDPYETMSYFTSGPLFGHVYQLPGEGHRLSGAVDEVLEIATKTFMNA
jgi:predicted esterase YcpF (UPF0227 family)